MLATLKWRIWVVISIALVVAVLAVVRSGITSKPVPGEDSTPDHRQTLTPTEPAKVPDTPRPTTSSILRLPQVNFKYSKILPGREVLVFNFSPDGALFALVSMPYPYGHTSRVDVFDSGTGELVRTVNAPKEQVLRSVSFSHNKEYIVSMGDAGGVWLIRLSDGFAKLMSSYVIEDAIFSADDSALIFFTGQGELKELNIDTSKIVRTLRVLPQPPPNERFVNGEFDATGTFLAAQNGVRMNGNFLNNEYIAVLKLASGEQSNIPTDALRDHAPVKFFEDLSRDGSRVLFETQGNGSDRNFAIWNLTDNTYVSSARETDIGLGEVAFTRSGQVVAYSDFARGLTWFSSTTGERVGQDPLNSTCSAQQLKFSNNGLLLTFGLQGSSDKNNPGVYCMWTVSEN